MVGTPESASCSAAPTLDTGSVAETVSGTPRSVMGSAVALWVASLAGAAGAFAPTGAVTSSCTGSVCSFVSGTDSEVEVISRAGTLSVRGSGIGSVVRTGADANIGSRLRSMIGSVTGSTGWCSGLASASGTSSSLSSWPDSSSLVGGAISPVAPTMPVASSAVKDAVVNGGTFDGSDTGSTGRARSLASSFACFTVGAAPTGTVSMAVFAPGAVLEERDGGSTGTLFEVVAAKLCTLGSSIDCSPDSETGASSGTISDEVMSGRMRGGTGGLSPAGSGVGEATLSSVF